MSDVLIDRPELDGLGVYEFGWHDSDAAGAARHAASPRPSCATSPRRRTSRSGCWRRRLKALQIFDRKPMPTWGADLSDIDFDNIKYFVRSTEKQAQTWEDLPEDIKNTYDKLGIPEAEKHAPRRRCRGAVRVRGRLPPDPRGPRGAGCDLPGHRYGAAEHPEFFQEYFGTVIPAGDNKFSALNTAVWSGGSFIYVPQGRPRRDPAAGVLPHQHREHGSVRTHADHRRRGQLRPLHRGLHRSDLQVRLSALGRCRDHREEGRARCRYTTIQNWSNNVYNLVTKRAKSLKRARTMEWIDGNIGSKVTMKYPAVWLIGRARQGRGALGRVRRRGPAPGHRRQDGPHGAVHVQSTIVSKSVARGGGRAAYRGLVQRRQQGATTPRHRANVTRCWWTRSVALGHLPLHRHPRWTTCTLGHEATVSKVSEEQLFYLMSRGMPEDEAMAMIVRGFVEPIARELPMEYALELNRLIEMQMEGSVG